MFVVKNKSEFKLEYVYDGKKGFINPKGTLKIDDVSKFETKFKEFVQIQPVVEKKTETKKEEVKKETKKATKRTTRKKKSQKDNQGDKNG